MFRILCDPSSGSTELCLTEITRSDSQIFCRVVFVCVRYGRTVHTHTTGSKLRCQTLTKQTTKYL